MAAEYIEEFFEPDNGYSWGPMKIRRDYRINPVDFRRDPLSVLPPDVQMNFLRHRVVSNKNWQREHLEWLKENPTDVFLLDERWIMFSNNEDAAMFVLTFENSD